MNVEEQVAELRKQIEELETVGAFEAELAQAKETLEPGSEELREIKSRLRAAREAQRSGRDPGTADPETIEATFSVEED